MSRPDAILIFVVMIWGANFGIVKTALNEINPMAFTALRLALAAPTILGVLFVLERRLLLEGFKLVKSRNDIAVFAGLGLLLGTNYILFTWGLSYTTSVNSAIICATGPLVVAVMSFLKGKPVNHLVLGGLAMASVGVLMVIGAPQGLTLTFLATSSTIRGDLLTGTAVVCWALYTHFSTLVLDRYSTIRVSTYAITGAAILAAVVSFPAIISQPWANVSWIGWTGFFYSMALSMVLGLVLWVYAVSQIGPLKVIIYQYLIPVVVFVLAFVLWKEAIYPLQVLGGILVLTGVRFVRVS